MTFANWSTDAALRPYDVKPYKFPVPKKPQTHHRGLGPNRYIYFYGQSANNANDFRHFSVLPGDTPPTIIGGYGQWQTVSRPLWRSLTQFQGYDPTSMQMSVRFMSWQDGSWLTDDQAGGRNEVAIGTLEWMAGMGRESGAPPFVWLSTSDVNGRTSALIPFDYQDSPTVNVPKPLRNHYSVPWVVTGIQWDESPVRNPNGFRIRQDATVTVQLFEGGSNQGPSVAHRKSKKPVKALAVESVAGEDTALKIAAQANTSGNRFALANAIVKYSGNRHLKLRSPTQKIRHGARVLVPFDF